LEEVLPVVLTFTTGTSLSSDPNQPAEAFIEPAKSAVVARPRVLMTPRRLIKAGESGVMMNGDWIGEWDWDMCKVREKGLYSVN
jgi:hypothetical protein